MFVLIPFAVVAQAYRFFFEGASGPAPMQFGLSQAFYNLALVAIPEEFFFRGYLQARLTAWCEACGITRPVFPIVLTAFLFAVAHLVVAPDLISAAVFLPGMVMGWLRYRTGGLLAPAGFHWLANMLWVALDF